MISTYLKQFFTFIITALTMAVTDAIMDAITDVVSSVLTTIIGDLIIGAVGETTASIAIEVASSVIVDELIDAVTDAIMEATTDELVDAVTGMKALAQQIAGRASSPPAPLKERAKATTRYNDRDPRKGQRSERTKYERGPPTAVTVLIYFCHHERRRVGRTGRRPAPF
jgi:hypothetical protein